MFTYFIDLVILNSDYLLYYLKVDAFKKYMLVAGCRMNIALALLRSESNISVILYKVRNIVYFKIRKRGVT